MARDSRWLLLVPEPVRTLPADLAATVALTLASVLSATLPLVRDSPVRVLLGLPLVLFLPGYAFVAALFPEAGEGPALDEDGADESTRERGIDGIERVALSFGLSIAISPLLGLVLNFTPWGIRLVPILVTLGGFTLVSTAVAAVRRRQLQPDERFRVPYRDWYASAREELLSPETRLDGALNVLLALSVLLAMGSVGYAIAVPKDGERFTELYVLTESDDGNLVADDYPTNFTRGEGKPLVVGIGNQEHEEVTYSLVVALHRVETATNETTVLERQELSRERTTLSHNETWHRPYEVVPTMTGENLRLTFLLYKSSAPAQPTVDNAYREVHLWVNVTEA
jgi:uncharacterized membrane protein